MASIRVELELQDGTFTTRMMRAGDTVEKFEQQVGQAVVKVNSLSDSHSNFLGKLRDVTIVLGLAREALHAAEMATTSWVGEIVKINAEFERLKILMAGMSKANDPFKDAAESADKMRKLSLDMPFSLKAMTDVMIKMKSTGTDPLNGDLKAMLDTVAAFGGGEAQLKRVGLALQEMSGKGVIQMKELRRQLGDTIPRAVELMARSLGMTMGEFTEAVSKGTLEAKSTLAGFYLELERVFGGAAQRQMETFNGQVQRMTTLIQNLALRVGETGFYDQIKGQIKELNSFLSSETAQAYADKLGRGLMQVIDALRVGIDWVVRFRHEIVTVIEVMAVGFAARAGLSGLLAMSGYFQTLVVDVGKFRASLKLVAVEMATIGTTTRNLVAIQALFGGSSVWTKFIGFLSAARVGLLGLAAAAIPLAVELAPLVILATAAAYAFGLFGDKAKEALDRLKDGTGDAADLKVAEKSLEALKKKIAASQRKAHEGATGPSMQKLLFGQWTEQEWLDYYNVPGLQKTQAEIERVLMVGRDRINKEQARRGVDLAFAPTEKTLEQLAHGYDQAQLLARASHEKTVQELLDHHKDVSQENARYRNEERQLALTADEMSLQVLKDTWEREKQGRTDKSEAALAIQVAYDEKMTKLVNETEQRIAKQRAQSLDPVFLQKEPNVDKLLEKAKGMLDDVNSKVAEQQAALQGVNGEYAKMAYMIESATAGKNNVWSLNNEQIRTYIDLLMKAQVQYNELQDAVRGKSEFDRDIENAYQKELQKSIELQTRGKSDLDKIAIKLREGAYGGQKPISFMARSLEETDVAARKAASGMSTFFGQTMIDQGNNLAAVIAGIHNDMNGINLSLDRTRAGGTLPLAFKPAGGSRSSGGYDTSDHGYLHNLIHSESGGSNDAAASSSSAVGAGQFIKDTWMAFLRDAHRELITGDATHDLGLRHDSDLSKEATMWYAAQNSQKLASNGITPDDANLKIAHFLGGEGAVAVLSKSSDTLLASVKAIHATIGANPGVFNKVKTVGDLRSWAQGLMGTGSTALYGKGLTGQNEIETLLGQQVDTNARKKIIATLSLSAKNFAGQGDQSLSDDIKDAVLNLQKLKEADGALGKETNYAKFRKSITEGKYGNDTDPDSPRYAKLLENLKLLDAQSETNSQHEAARSKIKSAADAEEINRKQLMTKLEEARSRLDTNSKFKDSADVVAIQKKIEDITQAMKQLQDGGKDTSAARKLIDDLSGDKALQHQTDLVNELAKVRDADDKVKEGLMTADEARDYAFNKQMKSLEALKAKLAEVYGFESAEVAKVTQYEADLAKQREMASPLDREMKNWGDVTQNLKQNWANTMNSLSGALTNFIMKGKFDVASFTQSIAQDFLKTGINGMLSKLMNGSGATSKLDAGSNKLGAASSGGGNKLFATHHTGGIAGGPTIRKMANALAFVGAPRFHTGGFPGLDPSEVPIIAKRGEEVGWPDQLAAKYGGGGFGQTNHFNISVQGSAGTADQNKDLADKIGQKMQEQAQHLVTTELRRQMRPGGIISANYG